MALLISADVHASLSQPLANAPISYWASIAVQGLLTDVLGRISSLSGTEPLIPHAPVNIPSGVSPVQCPNHPFCEPTPLEAFNYRNIQPLPANTIPAGSAVDLTSAVYPSFRTPATTPAGIAAYGCSTYPFCGPTPLEAINYRTHTSQYAHAGPVTSTAAKSTFISSGTLPASVSVHECPNYPFCGPTPTEAINYRRHSSSVDHTVPVSSTVGVITASRPVISSATLPVAVSEHNCPNYPFCGPTPVEGTNYRRPPSLSTPTASAGIYRIYGKSTGYGVWNTGITRW